MSVFLDSGSRAWISNRTSLINCDCGDFSMILLITLPPMEDALCHRFWLQYIYMAIKELWSNGIQRPIWVYICSYFFHKLLFLIQVLVFQPTICTLCWREEFDLPSFSIGKFTFRWGRCKRPVRKIEEELKGYGLVSYLGCFTFACKLSSDGEGWDIEDYDFNIQFPG